jgi:hypothetical protein
MKKVGFLSAGIAIVVIILAWQRENLPGNVKRIFHEVTHSIENGVIQVYNEIKSIVSV